MQLRRSSGAHQASDQMAGGFSAAVAAPLQPAASAASGTPKAGTPRRSRRQCSHVSCTKVDAGGGFCVGHGGGKKCSFPGCSKGYQTGGFCRRHGGGARCQVAGCGKVDAGRGLCRAHGGGKRCQTLGCPKADVGGGFCTAHGGGRRCSEPGCTKIDQGGGKCRAHGGAKRCRRRTCQQPARGSAGFCTDHGGARVCSVLNCRRLVRPSSDGGTMCASCAKTRQVAAANSPSGVKPSEKLSPGEASGPIDASYDSPRVRAEAGAAVSGALVLASFSPLSVASANARCDGSQVANCLENGCARSFGGGCNCVEDCTCNSPSSSPSTSRSAPLLTSSGATNGTTTSQTTTASTSDSFSLDGGSSSNYPASTPAEVMVLSRFVVEVTLCSDALRSEMVVALLTAIPGVRSVHVLSDGAADFECSTGNGSGQPASRPTPWLVVLRGSHSLELEKALAPLRTLQLAQFRVVEQSAMAWTRKEVVLRVSEMMCMTNCGTSVLNAVRMVEGVEASRLCFEHRQVVVRGDMRVDALCTAVTEIGFAAEVDAETPLPRRFRFRVDDLNDVGLNGRRLQTALQHVEGVENLVLLTDRAEVLVVAMLLDASSLLVAAARVGFEMLELTEEAWGIPMEVAPPSYGPSGHTQATSAAGASQHQHSHRCDMRVCPQNGCPRYMTTVAHTAALAVGWAVPGCGMSVGGECTCGDGCKCEGCPQHNPAS
ncbi:hypothetical protein BBJ28_00009676 [Nothophytophthora sp. Chile5]|nr:hypothetical protein BBJ28_00009676 [Nothophytophthora sp. Chile5]